VSLFRTSSNAIAEWPVPAEFQPQRLLRALVAHDVDFVVIGGLAGMARGSAYPSYDLDIAYARNDENLEALVGALIDVDARLRGAPPDVPFLLDAKTLRNGSNFTFATPWGSLDIIGEAPGAPSYERLRDAAGPRVAIEGELVSVASLDHLIAMKEAAGRPKDKLMATEYRVLSDELRAPRDSGGAGQDEQP
jgi:hypothetical protein